jgi:hypothetical protein
LAYEKAMTICASGSRNRQVGTGHANFFADDVKPQWVTADSN